MRPQDVALIIGIPLDLASFLRAWKRGSDYLHRAYTEPREGWAKFSDAARLAENLCLECKALGVDLYLEGTLSDLRNACHKKDIVILLAHMDFPPISARDVIAPLALMSTITGGSQPEWQLIRQRLIVELDNSTQRGSGNHCLAEDQWKLSLPDTLHVINSILKETQEGMVTCFNSPTSEAENKQGPPALQNLIRLARPRLEELLGPQILQPKGGVEFSGTMATAQQFIQAIPRDFSGTLDLRMCHSISLGTAVRRERPMCTSVVGRHLARIEAAMVLIKCTMRLLAAHQGKLSYHRAIRILMEAAQ